MGPTEQAFLDLWRSGFEGAPEMLASTFEERENLDTEEVIRILLRMLGTTQKSFRLLAAEIDKLNAA